MTPSKPSRPGSLPLLLLLLGSGCSNPPPEIEPVAHSILNPSREVAVEKVAIEVPAETVRLVEATATDVAPAQVAPAQVAPAQVAPAQVAPAQVAPAQVAPAQVAVVNSAEKEAVVTASLPLDGIEEMTILGGAGSLVVVVDESIGEFTFLARITARSDSMERVREIADYVRIDFRTPDPGSPRVMVVKPRLRDGEVCNVDFEVRVPPIGDGHSLKMTIQDAAGDVSINSFVGTMKVFSLEGTVNIEDVVGDLTVAPGSGPCTVTRITGNIKVRDGAGSLTISEVTGTIDIRDSGGPLVVRNVTGDVMASNNPDGIEAFNVVGDLTLYGIDHTRSKIDGVEGRIIYKTGSE